MPRVIQVIESEENEGDGTPKNVIRTVRRYYTLEGKLLAEYDTWLNRPKFMKGWVQIPPEREFEK